MQEQALTRRKQGWYEINSRIVSDLNHADPNDDICVETQTKAVNHLAGVGSPSPVNIDSPGK